MRTYKLTSTHTIYLNGKLKILNTGDTFELAGKELSSFGNNSPFHYKGDIIRLPNCILEYVATDEKILKEAMNQRLYLKTEPKPNPLPNYRNPAPPPPPQVYKAPVDRSGSEGRVFNDVVQYPLEEIKDDDDTPTTIILLISIIILLGYIIYKIEKYFN